MTDVKDLADLLRKYASHRTFAAPSKTWEEAVTEAADALETLAGENERLARECDRLTVACAQTESEVQQILGKALGYPWFKDDPTNFPGTTERDGVCVGDHVAASLAMEAVERLAKLAPVVEAARCGYWTACVTDDRPASGRGKSNARVLRINGTFPSEADALAAAEKAIAYGWVAEHMIHRESAKPGASYVLGHKEAKALGRALATLEAAHD